MRARVLRTSVVGLFIAAFFLLPLPAWCEFPDRPITVLVGNEAGGTADIITRGVVVGAEKYLGKAILVEARGGGGGSVALGALLTAKADGYTLAAVPNDALVNTPLMQKVPFKPLKDFVPIIGHSSSENTSLLVKPDSQWTTFAEFIDYAKKNPGKIKYSSAGVGTGMHTAMAFIAVKDNIKWVHVPFKGTAPARTALMGGHVDACSAGMDWVGFAQAGQVKPLVIHGRARMAAFPNVPTLRESGYDFVSETIHSIVAPAGMPPELVKKLEAAFLKGMETQEFKNAQARLALTPVMYTSKEYERHLKEHWVKIEKIFIEAGIIKEAASQPY